MILGKFSVHANFKCPTSEPTLFKGEGGCMFVATMTICRGKWFFICFFFRFLSVPRTFGDYCRFLDILADV